MNTRHQRSSDGCDSNHVCLLLLFGGLGEIKLLHICLIVPDFLDSCRANTLLAELDDEEDLPEPDDDDDENEDDNQEDQEYEEVLVTQPSLALW